MDFNLTQEQIAFQNSVRNLADKYLKEGNLRRAHDPLFPKDIAQYFLSWNLLYDILSNLLSSYFFIHRRTLKLSLVLNKLSDKKGLSSIL